MSMIYETPAYFRHFKGDTGLFPSFQSKERRTELPLEHKTLHKDNCKVFQS